MLNTGIFPDKVKISKIIPIYKNDYETIFTNYRPITLLSTLFKHLKSIALKLMESYMTNRTQYMEIEEVKSDLLNLSTGVPQGLILGHLLFIISIKDI